MSIDEKISNNWYLEQHEIQQLIKRYTIMKKLIILFISILTVFLITSCGSTGPEPEQSFEPYRIGSFMFVSESKAEYIGSNNKKRKVDSLLVTSPEDRGLTLYVDSTFSENGRVRFIYQDSTYIDMENYSDFQVDWATEEYVRYPEIQTKSVSSSSIVGDSTMHIRADGYISYECGSVMESDIRNFEFKFLVADTVHTVYTFKSDSVVAVMNDLRGDCN